MNFAYLIPILIVGVIPQSVSAEAMPPKRVSRDLVTHDSIVINERAARVWPLIEDNSRWKKGLKTRHLDGVPGQTGEVLAACDAAGKPVFYIENVEVAANKRRTVKLYDAENRSLIGYASWVLEEFSGKTRVSYHVYAEIALSAQDVQGLTAPDLARQQAQYSEENQRRFQAELRELKRLVETHAAPDP